MSQIVPVTAQPTGWVNLEEDSYSPRPGQDNEIFDVNLLDYMNIDEFLILMKNKTDNNYDNLWVASRRLAMQVKASKAVLSLSSQLCAGKSQLEVLEKLVESMKFSLNADHVSILQYIDNNNEASNGNSSGGYLQVTHSDMVGIANHEIPSDKGIEG